MISGNDVCLFFFHNFVSSAIRKMRTLVSNSLREIDGNSADYLTTIITNELNRLTQKKQCRVGEPHQYLNSITFHSVHVGALLYNYTNCAYCASSNKIVTILTESECDRGMLLRTCKSNFVKGSVPYWNFSDLFLSNRDKRLSNFAYIREIWYRKSNVIRILSWIKQASESCNLINSFLNAVRQHAYE